jgi:hypothetical protein
MNRQLARTAMASVLAAIVWSALPGRIRADAPPSTQPTTRIQTGELDLTFTQRSPLSTPKDLARRLNLMTYSLGDNYDLSTRPFKAYIPTNYDPAVPHGLFVYLGYKNTVSTPPLWAPVLEKYHLIFISPVCHSGTSYAPTVPLWQTVGLAFDAVYNCRKLYNIDDRRVYLMSSSTDSTKTSLSTADVFTGFVVAADPEYCSRIYLPGGNSYYNAAFLPPPADLMSAAKERAFFMIDDTSPDNVKMTTLIIALMRREGFNHLMMTGLSLGDDLHFPNMKAEWFEQQAIPFLDKATAAAEIVKPESGLPTTAPAAGSSPAVNPAQHLLAMAQLYISNGQRDLAQKKLQQIIDTYPNDPAAEKAKQLLGQLNQ